MCDKISWINEKAIELILAQDYVSAAGILSAGIALFEEDLAIDDDISSIGSADREEDCSHAVPLDFEAFVVATLPSMPKEADNKETTTCSYTFFEKALRIPRYVSLARDKDCNLICCILLYNHALCLHFQALETGNEAVLEEALLLYEMALGLVGLAGSGAIVVVLELAILNNCGQIHTLQKANRNVQAVLQRMQILLQVLHATNEVQYKLLSPFYFNLVYNAAQHQRPAPAA